MIELSIIILNYNTPDLTINCLKSVNQAAKNIGGVEIVVVDNGSKDNSISKIKKARLKYQSQDFVIRIVGSGQNVGFAAGNNLGLNRATGKYILFLNSDTIVNPEALNVALKKIKSDDTIGAITVKTILANGRIDPDCHRGYPTPWASITYFLGLEKLFPRSRLFGQYHQGFLNLNTDHEVPAGAGAFMLVSREIINKVGLWDEKYFFYGEDLDFYYRIKRAGYKIFYLSLPLLTHLKGASSGLRTETKKVQNISRENRIKVAKASIKAMEIFYRKFYQEKYPGWLTGLVLLGIKMKGLLRVGYHYLK